MVGLDDHLIIVISGPGGVGKGTIVRRLLEADDKLWLSQSWTTREQRPGEADDAYVFATRAQFEAAIAAGQFLEWVEFLDYYQGTPLPSPPPGHDAVFEIDLFGAEQIKERFPDAVLVFIDAPTRDEQEARLYGRGDPVEKVNSRLAKGDKERAMAPELGCTIVVNDDLEAAVATVENVIERARRDQM